jgi:hypothetical protein
MTTSSSVSNGASTLSTAERHEERENDASGPAVEHPTRRAASDAVRLDACRQFERIVVQTRSSVYDLIVLCGSTGEVLVRGGRRFPDFCQAVLAGSTDGRTGLVNTIAVGLRMELCADRKVIMTSAVTAVFRPDHAPCSTR